MIRSVELFLPDDYESLMAFFRKTWQEPSAFERYQYRVYLAQRCFNLNELFFSDAIEEADSEEKARLEGIRRRTFLSQSGLVMQAGNLAAYYRTHKAFPNVLICDELLKTGHDFMDVLMSLSRAVTEELRTGEQDNPLSEGAIYAKLLDAVSFCSYMQSVDDPRLLPIPYWRKTDGSYFWNNPSPASKWFSFLQNSSAAIVYSGKVENTGFIPTFWLSQEQNENFSNSLNEVHSSGWKIEQWEYWNKRATIWQRSVYNHRGEPVIQQALRCSFHTFSGGYSITPYLFWKPMEDTDSARLYTRFAAEIIQYSSHPSLDSQVKEPLKAFVDLLTSKKKYSLAVKTQLLFAIGSVLLFCGCLEDAGLDEKTQREILTSGSDLEKIAENFGPIENTADAFSALLCKEAAPLRAALWSILRESLVQRAECLQMRNRTDLLNMHDRYQFAAAEHLLRVDEGQQEQIQYRKKHSIDYGTISQYHQSNGFLSDYLDSFPVNYSSLDSKIGALLMLLMWGSTGLAICRRINDSDERFSDIYLNVGESTQIIKAMYMLRFLPALLRIERICKREFFSPRRMILNFGVYLDRKMNVNDHAVAFAEIYDWALKTGRTLSDWSDLGLKWLNKPDLNDQIRIFQEWNQKPWPKELLDQLEDFQQNKCKKEKMTDYLRWEESQQIFYYEQAGQFLFGS